MAKWQSGLLIGFIIVVAVLAIVLTIGLPATEDTGAAEMPYLDRAPVVASGAPVSPVQPGEEGSSTFGPIVVMPERFDISVPMRDIEAPPQRSEFHPEVEVPLPSARQGGEGASLDDFAAISQNWPGAGDALGVPLVNVDVLSNLSGYYPPDSNGDVGPDHYVEWINVNWAVYDKNGVIVPGWPKAGNSFWSGFGGPCQTQNNGDPIVIYDHLADRWMVSQFALPNPFYQCVAVSTTSDPTGSWYRYAYEWPNNKFNDYPHFGLWPDGYYLTVNQFNASLTAWQGAGVAALEREAMLAGDPLARMVYFDLYGVNDNYGSQLPADLEGDPPPAGTPNYIVEWDEAGVLGPTDAVGLWEFHVDWANPANSTLGVSGNPNVVIETDNVDRDICTANREQCIDQLSSCTSVRLEALSELLMWRVQYRDFGTHQTLVTNHTVDSNNPAGRAGIHWFELRDEGSGWEMHQQGVYAPADGLHRWMGSIAMDPAGNIALGYSVSSSSTYPSIRYTGRLAGDPPGTMPQTERTIVNGTGCQTGTGARWGDYSSLSLDTGGYDCVFWYVQEYIKTTGGASWQTRLASFEFDGCGQVDFALGVEPMTQDICAPNDAVYDLDLEAYYGYSQTVALSSSGRPTGTTESLAPSSGTPPFSSTLTIGNTGAAEAGAYAVDVIGDGPGRQHVATVGLNLYTAAPGAPAPVEPSDGAIGVSTSPTLTWSAAAQGGSYTVEIATDPAFSSVVASAADLSDTRYVPGSPLAPDTVYYWRVQAENACGVGNSSPVRAFRTGVEGCRTYASADVPLGIPDKVTVTSTLDVPDSFALDDVNVVIGQIAHGWAADLDIFIRHPDSTEIELSTGNGGSGDDYVDTILDQEATTSIVDGVPPFSGRFRPEGDLGTLYGTNSAGIWSLRIYDKYTGFTGRLDAWSLELCGSLTAVAADYSDLEASYGVASHSGDGAIRLGANWSADDGFTPVGSDDADDDGVTLDLSTPWREGAAVRVDVAVTAANGVYTLAAWFDWNDDGDFLDVGEQVIGQSVTGGASPGFHNTIEFVIPTGVGYTPGRDVSGRFRLYADEPGRARTGSELPYGDVAGGEVEDTRFAPGGRVVLPLVMSAATP